MQISDVSNRRYIISLLSALLLLSLFIGLPLIPKEQNAILIQGIVLDSQNKPISNIAITFSSPDSKIVKRKKISTSDSGRFEFLQNIPAALAGKKLKATVKIGDSTYAFPISSDKQSWAFFQRIRPDTYKINIGHTLKNRIEVTGNFSIQASTTKAIFRDGNRYAVTRTNEGIFSIKELDSSDTVINENVALKAMALRKTTLGTIDGKPVTFNEQGEVFYDGSPIGNITFFADSLKAQTSLILETKDAVNNPVGNYEIAIKKESQERSPTKGIPSMVTAPDLDSYSLSRSVQFNEMGEIKGEGIHGKISLPSQGRYLPTVSRGNASTSPKPHENIVPPSPLPSAVPSNSSGNSLLSGGRSNSEDANRPTQTAIAFATQMDGWSDTIAAMPHPTCSPSASDAIATPKIADHTILSQERANSYNETPKHPVEPVPSDPFPSTCDMDKKIHVYCFDQTADSAPCVGACAMNMPTEKNDPLKMFLSTEICKSTNMCGDSGPDGAPQSDCTMSQDEFRDKTQCQGHIADTDDGSGLMNCCAVRHEYSHLCDSLGTKHCGKTEACGETIAEKVQAYCVQNTLEYYCGGVMPRWNDSDNHRCKKACGAALYQAKGKVWDACMCNQALKSSSGVTGDQCCGCASEVEDKERVWNLLPPSCRKEYPNPDSLPTDSKVDLWNGFIKSTHDCNYYNPVGTEPGAACASWVTKTPTRTPKASPTSTFTTIPSSTPTTKTEVSPVLPELPSR